MIERGPSTLNYHFSEEASSLLQRDEVVAILENIAREYYPWHVVKHLDYPPGLKAHDVWAMVKMQRRLAPARIKFGEYSFHWNITNEVQEFLHFIDMNAGGSLESSYKIPDEDKGRYLVSSVMEEAIASSQIEGAVTTRKQAKEMLRQNKKPANKSEQMIVNNYNTIRRILEIKSEPLTIERLLDLHRIVTDNTFVKKAEEGALRADDDINVVDSATGQVVHHPPPHTELEALLGELCNFFNDDKPGVFIHPLVKACIIHFMVGFIHPFADGNGRTARALFYWYLLKKGYWLTEYLSISRLILRARAQYARAFQNTEVDEHDLTYFIIFNLKVTRQAFDELRSYIQRKNEEKKHLSTVLGVDGIDYRQSVILEWFRQEPALLLTVKETQTRLAVSNQTARNALKELSQKGYLEAKGLNKVASGYVRGAKFETLFGKTGN